MNLNRVTSGVTFNTGISMSEYNDVPAGQTKGQTQGAVLPGSTTVSEALDSVFPRDPTVGASILGQMAAEGNSVALRSANGFRRATHKTIRSLKDRKGRSPAAERAAAELEALLEDTELLDFYRASLLES